MIKIGLTGGIGSGKSTISSYLKEKNIPIVDADKISREVVSKYKELRQELKDAFGSEFFDEKDNLKRRELGAYVFKEKSRKELLEAIIMPYIKKEIYLQFEDIENKNYKVCILDAPTLIEQGLNEEMDYNILVWIPERLQIKRVKKRDGLRKAEILRRIEAQMSLDEKRKKVDYVLNNSKNFKVTEKKLDEILKKLESLT